MSGDIREGASAMGPSSVVTLGVDLHGEQILAESRLCNITVSLL
jgi:hypothetical protein